MHSAVKHCLFICTELKKKKLFWTTGHTAKHTIWLKNYVVHFPLQLPNYVIILRKKMATDFCMILTIHIFSRIVGQEGKLF